MHGSASCLLGLLLPFPVQGGDRVADDVLDGLRGRRGSEAPGHLAVGVLKRLEGDGGGVQEVVDATIRGGGKEGEDISQDEEERGQGSS